MHKPHCPQGTNGETGGNVNWNGTPPKHRIIHMAEPPICPRIGLRTPLLRAWDGRMDVEGASCKSATAHCGNGGAKPASTFETRCYERVLDCEQQIQSSALFRDAELVDSPKEVTRAICSLCL